MRFTRDEYLPEIKPPRRGRNGIKVSGPKRRRPKKPRKAPRQASVDIIVTSKPRNECSMHRGKPQHEVVVTGIVYEGNAATSYVIRFVHAKEVEAARRLVSGTRLHVRRGIYQERKGRKISEFQVRESELRQLARMPSFLREVRESRTRKTNHDVSND